MELEKNSSLFLLRTNRIHRYVHMTRILINSRREQIYAIGHQLIINEEMCRNATELHITCNSNIHTRVCVQNFTT